MRHGIFEIEKSPTGHELADGHSGAPVQIEKRSEVAAGNLREVHAKTANTWDRRVITFTLKDVSTGAPAAGQSTETQCDSTVIVDTIIINPSIRGSLLGVSFNGPALWIPDDGGTFHMIADILLASGANPLVLKVPARRYRLSLAISTPNYVLNYVDFASVVFANLGR